MRPIIPILGSFLACAAVPAAAQEPVYSQIVSQMAPDAPSCREYTAQVTIDGVSQALVGRACQQSDGTWQTAEGLPGQPAQIITYASPYPVYPYYYAYPWLWEPPIGLSLGATVIFIDRTHHFHDFRFAHRPLIFRPGFVHPGFRTFAFGGFHQGFDDFHRRFGFGGPHGFGGMGRR